MTVTLRTASSEDDLVAVGRVHQRSRVAAYAGILSASTLALRTEEAFGEWWTERYRWEKDTHRLTLAVDSSGEVIGFSYVGPSETPGAVELYAIHVLPSALGTGVGRQLMVDALTSLAALGEPRAVLWVLEANSRARDFYVAGGWKPDGATREEPVNGEPVAQLRYMIDLRRAFS
ncbi:N-acetyltransferase [Paractinoplanes abujensis]|uniref:Ribosomal protein S18 acetylase RimI-like enzyme n=1 Tax=Paractinoplanes abujensis TaxID=882441 RepID=A0A7W7CV04_9ACTN|nr:GNAT family N-acetyltransferase [Actinoplanes abujensis]MBB4695177.1 ribosomal protein S18 acetylase RimI-like enzyme [Actinoplanes abujensis]GID23911.1 N-acetyltransferase [Actinoplanes abujensis]